MAAAIAHDDRPIMEVALPRVPLVGAFARLVGPVALTAAGMIGAGAVATRLLAGAWFGFDLLWVALYVIPLLLAPAAVAVIFHFVNRFAMGELRATTGRNVLLAITLVFAVSLALIGAVRLVR